MSIEQALIVTCGLSGAGLPSEDCQRRVALLEDEIEELIEKHALGELDGHEYGDGQVVLYLYSSDARRLFYEIEHLLRDFGRGSGRAVIRLGGPENGTPEEVVEV